MIADLSAKEIYQQIPEIRRSSMEFAYIWAKASPEERTLNLEPLIKLRKAFSVPLPFSETSVTPITPPSQPDSIAPGENYVMSNTAPLELPGNIDFSTALRTTTVSPESADCSPEVQASPVPKASTITATATKSQKLPQFFVPNTVMVTRATRCVRVAAGTYYARSSLLNPEGRHLCLRRAIDELMGCLDFLGVTANKKHVFSLVMGLKEPENDLDRVVQRTGRLLKRVPHLPMTREAIINLYCNMVEGLSIGAPEKLEQWKKDTSRMETLDTFCEFIHNADQNADHPIIKILLAAECIQQLKPFPTINLIMARLLFSWAANEVGLPLAAFCPMVHYLDGWRSNTLSMKRHKPGLPSNMCIITSQQGADWSPLIEEMLGFLADDLDYFESQLLRLLLKRQRIEYLVNFDSDLNERQRAIVAEFILHEDAEYTYATAMDAFGASYATVYADLNKLEDRGYAKAVNFHKATVFIAGEAEAELLRTIKEKAPEEYCKVYDEEGNLLESYKAWREQTMEQYRRSIPPEGAINQAKPPVFLPERALNIIAENNRCER